MTEDPDALLAASEAQGQAARVCPGEASPPTCTCDCEGCKYHCGAHQRTVHDQHQEQQ